MLKELEQMGLAWAVLVTEQLKLFTLEAKLAKMSFLPALLCAFALLLLCISTWGCALALAGYGVFYATQSLFLALLTSFVVNLGILGSVALLFRRYLRRMSFRYTRAQLHEYNKLEQAD